MNSNLLRFALTLALGATLGFGAAAQTKKELATKLLQLQQTGVENIGRSLAGQAAQRILQGAAQGMQRVPVDKREAIGREIQADVKKFYDDVEPLLRKRAIELAPSVVGTSYEDRFSEDELKQIIAWLESPVSKKFSQLDAELGQAMAAKLVAETRATVDPRLAALESTVVNRLGIKPPTAASSPKKP